jgi:hypothetical protein
MLDPTSVTWILLVFGWSFIFLPMLGAQVLMVLRPHSQRAKDIMIGKGEEWRDQTHFKSAYAIAVADLVLWLPLMLAGSIGVATGQSWGYVMWAASGAISVYISIAFWFLERDYVYPKAGPFAYYTYVWGFFVYWGVAVTIYSVVRVAGAL